MNESTGRARWHAEGITEVEQRLDSPESGLEQEEVRRRLERYGDNVIARAPPVTPLQMLLRQLKDPLLLVLIGSGVLAIALGKLTDGAVVLAVVLVNTLMGFVQEYRAGQAIDSLSQLVPQRAEVKRTAVWTSVGSSELVPGDRVKVSAGDKVPADLRLTRVKSLAVDEAMLTGESVPTTKQVEVVEADAEVGDQSCLAFKGTLATYGTAEGIVVRTGSRTELGRISELLSKAPELETPLTRALATLGKQITVAILALAIVITGIGIWRDSSAGAGLFEAARDAVMFAIALAVGAIPEGLPAVVTIALAIGVRRMANRNAIVRKLPSVETLGSTTVICSDKTGTLTRSEMTVRRVWTPRGGYEVDGVGYGRPGEVRGWNGGDSNEALVELCRAAVLCSDARVTGDGDRRRVEGDPTEGALVVLAEKAGLDISDERSRHERLDAVAFNSERKYMATLYRGEGGERLVSLKGAVEVVLDRCKLGGELTRGRVEQQMTEFARQGMRVLALSQREQAASESDELTEEQVDEGGFRLLALFGMVDPPRPEAIDSIARCHQAGVVVKMVTGDHAATAEAIGRELGLQTTGTALAGRELTAMSDDELWHAARQTNIFARVSPENKLRVVRALQRQASGVERAEVVAMTGDGVNDAPALKQADIGVAMGLTGTAASQDAADLVLTDDNFATIVSAMEEGRRVYDNLVKSLAFVLPTNLALALILVYAVIFFPFDPARGELLLPIKPTQLLWINLVAAVALALPLAFEAKEPNLMRRPPRPPNAPVFSSFLVFRTALAAITISAVAIGTFSLHHGALLAAGTDPELALREAQTLAVTTVVLAQIFYLLNCRSLDGSVLAIGFWSNPMLFLGIGVVVLLQGLFIYAPFMHGMFSSRPLGATNLLWAAGAGLVVMLIIAVEKFVRARVLSCRTGSSRGTANVVS